MHISTARDIVDTTAPYELVSKMRASFWVIGPLLARMGEAKVSLPGGCAIGTRPVDLLHRWRCRRSAPTIDIDARLCGRPRQERPEGREIDVSRRSRSAARTSLLMAASLADGETVIENAAREPEVVDLADCLIKMGAKIYGAGTSRIVVEGVVALNGARHACMPDRIETGTYAMAVAMTGGDVLLESARAGPAADRARRAGAGRRRRSPRAIAGIRVPPQRRAASSPVDVDHRAVPGLPDRPAGAAHGR